jgi:hypothetical protein
MTILTKPVDKLVKPTLPNVKPTAFSIRNTIAVLKAAVGQYYMSTDDVLNELNPAGQLPDFLFFPQLRAPLTDKVITYLVNTCTVSPNGRMVFDYAPDALNIDYLQTKIEVTELSSFKSVTMNFNDMVPRYDVTEGRVYPYMQVKVFIDAAWHTIIDEFSPSLSSKSITLTNEDILYQGRIGDQMEIMIFWDENMPIVAADNSAVYPYWNSAPSIFFDFENEWEKPLFATGFGLISALVGSISAGVVEYLAKQLTSIPALQKIALAVGVAAVELATQYLQAVLYFTLIAKTRSFDSLSLDEFTGVLTSIEGLLAMGTIAGGNLLSQSLGPQKGGQIISLITGGAGAIAIGAAYLTALGINKYYKYY